MKRRVSIFLVFILSVLSLCGFNLKDQLDFKYDKGNHKYTYDYHMHIYSDELLPIINSMMPPQMQYGKCSADRIISTLDEAKVEKAFVLSAGYIWGMDGIADENEYVSVMRENDYFAEQIAKYPDRLIGFVGINPLRDYAVEEIERCYTEKNFKGIKIHCANSNISLKNPEHVEKIKKVFAKAEELNMPIAIHLRNRDETFGKEDVQIFLNDIVMKYPNVKLQVAHLGGYGGFDETTKEAFRTFIDTYQNNSKLNKDNIYLDLSGVIITEKENLPLPLLSEEQLKELTSMLREWGIHHIIMGSDFPTATTLDSRKYIEKTFLSKNEIKSIISRDIYREFFGKDKNSK